VNAWVVAVFLVITITYMGEMRWSD